jgi:hypothetical protein
MGEVARGDWALSSPHDVRRNPLYNNFVRSKRLQLPCAVDWFKLSEAGSSALWSKVWLEHGDRLTHCCGQCARDSATPELCDS